MKNKMKNMITEVFNFKVGKTKKKDGTDVKIAFIDNKTSENTYQYKDKIKNEFGAYWDAYNKRWFWYLSDDQAVIDNIVKTKIEPCIDFLVSIEENEDGNVRVSSEVKTAFNTLIKQIDQLIAAQTSNPDKNQILSFDEIKTRLKEYKNLLVESLRDGEFKKMLEPIIKFKQNQGHKFSFINSILAVLQDNEAKFVKSTTGWKQYNRTVKPGSPSIALYVPSSNSKPLNKEEKERIILQFLSLHKKKKLEDLTSGEKDELRVILNPVGGGSFKLVSSFYDVRHTEVMSGKEDGAQGYDAIDNVEWFDDSEENETTIKLYNAVVKVIQESGLKFNETSDLGGARGVSHSGSIEALNGTKNAGMVNTLVHELSHELLHQKYLKAQGEEYANYFIGKAEGRAVVEQQAEVSAWIVMKSFGFDLKTSINYIGLWGIDDVKAVKVFDTVANVSTFIVKRMSDMLNGVNENKIILKEITGLEVAQLCGKEALDAYKKSQELIMKREKANFQEVYNRLFGKTI